MIRKAALCAGLLLALTAQTTQTAFTIDYEHPSAPPLGVGRSDLSQAAVIDGYARALKASRHWTSRSAHYTLAMAALRGTLDEVADHADYADTSVLGPLHHAAGRLHGQAWFQNESGEVVFKKDVVHEDVIDNDVLRNPLQHVAEFSLLGRSRIPDAYVVRIDPPGGRLKFVFLDPKTFAIVREDTSISGRRHVVEFDDFRSTDGVTEAWHLKQTDGYEGNLREYTLASVAYDQPVATAALAIPTPSSLTTLGASPAKVTDTIVSDRVIVTVHINGRPVNLQLDSGAAMIVIDRPILDALHIDTVGKETMTTAGPYVAGSAIVPKMTFGNVTMTNVAVTSIPFAEVSNGAPVAGLLGFDFFDSVVVHIDYLNGRVEALDPTTFVPPANATRIPLALDDSEPYVTAMVAHAAGTRFVVDTGADNSALFSRFVLAHPNDVADQGLGQQMEAAFPFERNFMGVGGLVPFKVAQVANFQFGNSSFDRWTFQTVNKPEFEFGVDGLVGQDVLRYFDVYFDYPHQALYVIPNQRYIDRFGT